MNFGSSNDRETTVFLGNLSFECVQGDIDALFEGLNIVSVRLPRDEDDRPRGIGYVEFRDEDSVQKALTMDGAEFMGRPLRVNLAGRKGRGFSGRGGRGGGFRGGGRGGGFYGGGFQQRMDPGFGDQGMMQGGPGNRPIPLEPPFTAFVGNLALDTVQADIDVLFNGLGVKDVRIPRDRETNEMKGIAYVEFETPEGLQQALTLHGAEFRGQVIRVDVAMDKRKMNRGGFQQGRGGRYSNFGGHDSMGQQGGFRGRGGGGGFGDRGRGYDPAFASFAGRNQRQRGDFHQRGAFNRRHDNPMESRVPNDIPAELTEEERAQRPKLKLAPRTVDAPTNAPATNAKSNPFGGAKPVDTATPFLKKEEEILKKKEEAKKLEAEAEAEAEAQAAAADTEAKAE